MANRLLRNDLRSFVPGLVLVAGKAVLNADGTAGTLTANGVSSFARTSAGLFTLTLADNFNALISAHFQLAAAVVKGYTFELVSETVASTKIVTLKLVKNGVTSSAPTFTGTPVAAHAHDLLIKGGQAAAGTAALAWYATDILGKEAATDKTILGVDSATKGGIIAGNAHTPAGTVSAPTNTVAAAVTDVSAAATLYFTLLLRNSSVSR